jgi:hypothetical protein
MQARFTGRDSRRGAAWLAGAGLLLALAGCAGAGTCAPAVSRGAGLDVLTAAGAAQNQQAVGSAPFAVGAALTATPGVQDRGLTASQLLGKAELDFGDGGGWVDVTAQQLALGAAWGASLAQSAAHTYTAAGTYTIRGRVTYWDGQVIEAWDPWTVTVR